MYSDKQIIERNIYEWLISNNSLLIPDLGQFNAVYKNTVIHPGIHHFNPPNKDLTFVPSSKFNDGVFENFVAEKEDIPVVEVQNKIKQYVTTVKIEVGINRKYNIQNFGFLVLNPDGVLEFRPDENANFLAESYGLPNLFYKPIERVNLQMEGDEDEPIFDQEELAEPQTTNSTAIWKYIAGAAVLAGISFGVWYVAQNELISFSGFSSTEDSPKEDEKVNVVDKTKNKEDKETKNNGNKEEIKEKTVLVEEDNKTNASTKEIKLDEDKITTDGNGLKNFAYNPTVPANLDKIMVNEPTLRYYVIIGSFDETGNAYSFYNNALSKGLKHCKIINQNKKYRISSQDFKTKEEAASYQNKLKNTYQIDAWTMRY